MRLRVVHRAVSALLMVSAPSAGLAAPASLGNPHTVYQKTELTLCFMGEEPMDLTNVALPWDNVRATYRTKTGGRSQPPPLAWARFSVEDRERIRAAVELTFTPERTGVHFTGFKDCREAEKADVIFFRRNMYHPMMVAGFIGDPGRSNGSKTFLKTMNSVSIHWEWMAEMRSYLLKLEKDVPAPAGAKGLYLNYGVDMYLRTVVHELGHVAGLYHEHTHEGGAALLRRLDYSEGQEITGKMLQKPDPDEAVELTGRRKVPAKHVEHPEEIGPVDVFSTMSYVDQLTNPIALLLKSACHSDDQDLDPALRKEVCIDEYIEELMPSPKENGYLSAGDVATLRYLYLKEPPVDTWTDRNLKVIEWYTKKVPLVLTGLQRTLLDWKK